MKHVGRIQTPCNSKSPNVGWWSGLVILDWLTLMLLSCSTASSGSWLVGSFRLIGCQIISFFSQIECKLCICSNCKIPDIPLENALELELMLATCHLSTSIRSSSLSRFILSSNLSSRCCGRFSFGFLIGLSFLCPWESPTLCVCYPTIFLISSS